MQKILPDTNIFIDWLNHGLYGEVLFAKGALKHLSAVVLLELQAGAFSKKDQRMVDKLAQNFQRAGRIVLPTVADYREGGILLRRLQDQKGYDLRKSWALVNDVLIALSARQIGAVLLTQNTKDFKTIREFLTFSFAVV